MQTSIWNRIFRWLPIQLFLLHFRSHQMLLLFWLILILVITDSLAASYGASSLFLAPRYLGEVSWIAYIYLGWGFGLFTLAWQITTFILHHYRIPFLIYSRNVFIEFAFNNSLIPVLVNFLFIYKIAQFLRIEEGKTFPYIIGAITAYFLGILWMFLLAFFYFSKAEKGLIRSSFERILRPTNHVINFLQKPSREGAILNADTFISLKGWFTPIGIKKITVHRWVKIIINRQQANGAIAFLLAFVILLIVGFFIDYSLFQIPAGVGILLLLSMLIAGTGMLSYLWRSWTLMGWILIVFLGMLLVSTNILDFRSHVLSLHYYDQELPTYQYEALKEAFDEDAYFKDLKGEEARLRNIHLEKGGIQQPLVLIAISGGGSRSMYWSFRVLEYIDSLSEGALFDQTILITGASGGMIGGAYWRNLHIELSNQPSQKYKTEYQESIGSDFLNPVILGLVTLDLVNPLNKINSKRWRSEKDRGRIFEQTLDKNTQGIISGTLNQYKNLEDNGSAPLLIPYATILNDGRKIYFPSRNMRFLTRSKFNLNKEFPIIDAVDASAFFQLQNVDSMSINSALRMSASFPGVMPMVHLPSEPRLKILDAGLRDNYGIEMVVRYLNSLEEVINEIASEVIILQIRDTRAYWPYISSSKPSLNSILTPVLTIQQNWNAFQTFRQSYIDELALSSKAADKLNMITLTYVPEGIEQGAPLNFFLTQKQKESILKAVQNNDNINAINKLKNILNGEDSSAQSF